MYRLCVLSIILSVSAFDEPLYSDMDYVTGDKNVVKMERELRHHKFFREERDMAPLWALDIDSNYRRGLRLRKANKLETYEFEYYMGPMIKNGGIYSVGKYSVGDYNVGNYWFPKFRGNARRPHNTQADKLFVNSQAAMVEVMKIVNNFVLSAYDSTFDENGPVFYETGEKLSSPTIIVFFKGPYSSVNIKFGSNEWRFFISPPSPLPRWFYEPPAEGSAVPVPRGVEKEFYYVFLRLLNKLLKVEKNEN